ncbi:unnamed protein product [Alternaria alternata]
MSDEQPIIWHGDGRENVLLNHIMGLPNLAGRPGAILSAIDEWSAKNKILMTIGQERGDLILDVISSDKPKVMVELGGYVGYSAIKFGQALRNVGGQRYLSLEASPEYAEIARSFIRLAGLDDVVQVIVGPSSGSLVDLATSDPPVKIDVLFIDHAASLYEQDLKLAETHSLLSMQAVVIADNILDTEANTYVAKMYHPGQALDSAEYERFTYASRILNFKLQSGEQVGQV